MFFEWKSLWKREILYLQIILKTDHIDTFPVLGNSVINCIQDIFKKGVSKFLKSAFYDFKCMSVIMRSKILYIFHKYDFWMFLPYNPGNIKKKSSAAVLKSTLLATDRESLARKPGTEDVVVRNRMFIHFGDVPFR